MKEQLIVPQIGESVSEAQISKWLVENGESVMKDQDIVEIDSDKTTLTISAPTSGQIHIIVQEGTIVKIGQLIAEIDTSVAFELKRVSEQTKKTAETAPVQTTTAETIPEQPISQSVENDPHVTITPLAMKKMQQEGIHPEMVLAHVKKYRLGIADVENFQTQHLSFLTERQVSTPSERTSSRKPMSPLRKKLAQRLVAVKNQTAMLTTFNEIDMSMLIDLRNRYKDDFQKKYGVKLGFMTFFAKACAIALKKFPSVNAMIDQDDILYYNYCDISIAVSTDKGLVVPVIRNVDNLNFPQIELAISQMADKARNNKLVPEDFDGGTFTITNGGIFGSLLSTPIINPPQTAILGMHNIQDRPVAINGQVVIRPMMYIALSYDHRIIDGKESVGFVIEVKRLLENPAFLQIDGNDTYRQLLNL
jgi:2-oxoglutarate dehydrogenase E2 component (dihydrolipoamide succinyltransferase)